MAFLSGACSRIRLHTLTAVDHSKQAVHGPACCKPPSVSSLTRASSAVATPWSGNLARVWAAKTGSVHTMAAGLALLSAALLPPAALLLAPGLPLRAGGAAAGASAGASATATVGAAASIVAAAATAGVAGGAAPAGIARLLWSHLAAAGEGWLLLLPAAAELSATAPTWEPLLLLLVVLLLGASALAAASAAAAATAGAAACMGGVTGGAATAGITRVA